MHAHHTRPLVSTDDPCHVISRVLIYAPWPNHPSAAFLHVSSPLEFKTSRRQDFKIRNRLFLSPEPPSLDRSQMGRHFTPYARYDALYGGERAAPFALYPHTLFTYTYMCMLRFISPSWHLGLRTPSRLPNASLTLTPKLGRHHGRECLW